MIFNALVSQYKSIRKTEVYCDHDVIKLYI